MIGVDWRRSIYCQIKEGLGKNTFGFPKIKYLKKIRRDRRSGG